jgi:hypothetical protein
VNPLGILVLALGVLVIIVGVKGSQRNLVGALTNKGTAKSTLSSASRSQLKVVL